MRKEAAQRKGLDVKALLAALRNALYVFLLLLCAFLLVVVIWLSVDKFIIRSPVPSFMGYSLLSVESGSMEGDREDSISTKDLILIHGTKDYQIGETVTYLRPGDSIPTTHRIIGFDDTGGTREYVTRGDANGSSRDENVTEDMILGEVVFIFEGVGVFRGFITEGGGYIFLITLAVILFSGLVLLRMVDKKEPPKKEADEKKRATQPSKEIGDE